MPQQAAISEIPACEVKQILTFAAGIYRPRLEEIIRSSEVCSFEYYSAPEASRRFDVYLHSAYDNWHDTNMFLPEFCTSAWPLKVLGGYIVLLMQTREARSCIKKVDDLAAYFGFNTEEAATLLRGLCSAEKAFNGSQLRKKDVMRAYLTIANLALREIVAERNTRGLSQGLLEKWRQYQQASHEEVLDPEHSEKFVDSLIETMPDGTELSRLIGIIKKTMGIVRCNHRLSYTKSGCDNSTAEYSRSLQNFKEHSKAWLLYKQSTKQIKLIEGTDEEKRVCEQNLGKKIYDFGNIRRKAIPIMLAYEYFRRIRLIKADEPSENIENARALLISLKKTGLELEGLVGYCIDGLSLPKVIYWKRNPEAKQHLKLVLSNELFQIYRNEAIERNLRLVYKAANMYHSGGLSFQDLIQEGNIGLMKGVDRWDYCRGIKMSTYVFQWIMDEIHTAVNGKSHTIRLSRNTCPDINKVQLARERIAAAGIDDPTLDEVVAESSLNRRRVLNAYNAPKTRAICFNQINGEDSTPSLYLIKYPAAISQLEETLGCEMKAKVERMLGTLTQREEDIIRKRFGLNDEERYHTLEEVGQMHSLTKERIRQIENETLRKLRIRIVNEEFAELYNK